jgi:hypothetical protein
MQLLQCFRYTMLVIQYTISNWKPQIHKRCRWQLQVEINYSWNNLLSLMHITWCGARVAKLGLVIKQGLNWWGRMQHHHGLQTGSNMGTYTGGKPPPPRNSSHLFCHLHPTRNFSTPPLKKMKIHPWAQSIFWKTKLPIRS